MIFYFSGTGNSRWAAETIAHHIGERLLSIADEMSGECRYMLDEGERIGFVFPIHGWQPPAIVRKFIRKMAIENADGHYTYALCTCGDTVGDAITIFNKELNKKGLHVSSSFSLVMPESYVCLPFMFTDTPEREKTKIDTATGMLAEFVDAIDRRAESITQLKTGPTPRLYSYVIGAYFNRCMITDKPFTVDEMKCIKCGKCAEVCPVNNIIRTEEGMPAWIHNGDCTCCLACYHYCPTHAVNYGKITRNRGQYHFKK